MVYTSGEGRRSGLAEEGAGAHQRVAIADTGGIAALTIRCSARSWG